MLRLELLRISVKKLFVQDLKAGNLKEEEQREEDGVAVDIHNMKDKGLGDTIARATKATGLDKFAQQFAEGLNIPGGCGCKKRQAYLNKVVPYGKK
jgi:hypothetical protein